MDGAGHFANAQNSREITVQVSEIYAQRRNPHLITALSLSPSNNHSLFWKTVKEIPGHLQIFSAFHYGYHSGQLSGPVKAQS